jgi:hypothetical protein
VSRRPELIQAWSRRRLQRRQLRQIRGSLAELLREISTLEPVSAGSRWELPVFCEAVARHRGRPIELVPHDMPNEGPDGIFQGLGSVDVVIYDQNTTVLHQEQIVLHELGHLLLGHKGGSVVGALPPALTALLDTDAGGDRPPRLHRDTYSDRQELEAEYAASMLSRYIGRRPLAPPRVLQGAEADTVDRLAAVLGRAKPRA